MFSMRHIVEFAPVMAGAAAEMLARWRALGDGAEIDAADEMMRLTYDIISRTLFSNDVTMQYGKMSEALHVYLETQGRVDMLRTIGMPNWVPTPKQSARPRAFAVFPQGIERFGRRSAGRNWRPIPASAGTIS